MTAIDFSLEDRRARDVAGGKHSVLVFSKNLNLCGVKPLDEIRRMRGDQALRSVFEKIVRNAALRMRGQSDFWFFHCKDYIIFLDLSNECQQRKNKRVKRTGPDLLKRNRRLAR